MRTRVSIGLVVVIAAASLPGVASAAAGPQWTLPPPVPVPDGTIATRLDDVAVASPTDVWAVGAWLDTELHPLAVHWDGSQWTLASVGPTGARQLTAVDAVTADGVWAVGASEADRNDVAAAVRYDGVAWRAVEVPPTPAGSSSILSDVDMVSADDGWAVGGLTTGSAPAQPIVLRWREGRWTAVTLAVRTTGARLESVTAAAADSVWAVGTRTLDDGRDTALVLHFDGVAWSDVSPPDRGRTERLVSVAAADGSDVWAVGSTCAAQCAPLVLRRVGGLWQAIPAHNHSAVLTEVVVLIGEVWLIGHIPTTLVPQVDHAEFFDGRRFVTDGTLLTVLPPVSNSGKPGSAVALAAAAGDKASHVLWAVGWSGGPPLAPHAVIRS